MARSKKWWVVWISLKDNQFHYCEGFDDTSAHKTASLLVEVYGIRRSDNDCLIASLRMLAEVVRDGDEIYRDTKVENPFHFASQAWAIRAKSGEKAVQMATQAWSSNQLGAGDD